MTGLLDFRTSGLLDFRTFHNDFWASPVHLFTLTAMFRKIILVSFLSLLSLGLWSEPRPLKFHDGTFKIVQFTDLHYKLHRQTSERALQCIRNVVRRERPDLIVVTGDVVYSRPSDSTLAVVTSCLSATGIPWVMVPGNHDGERGLTVQQINGLLLKSKNNIQPAAGDDGSLDFVLHIRSTDGSRDAALLYCLDSHDDAQKTDVGGYAWLTPDQVRWYIRESNNSIRQCGDTLPALAFFHIPLPEFAEAAHTDNDVLIGNRMEKVCCPRLNTGMFAAMRLQGDVMGVFCGHDHDNDYAVMHQGILLAYGRFSGGNTEYNHLKNGARVILLKENSRSFETWIDLSDGGECLRVTFPGSFVKDDWKLRKEQ